MAESAGNVREGLEPLDTSDTSDTSATLHWGEYIGPDAFTEREQALWG